MKENNDKPSPLSNYCIAFIDILGQRNAMEGQTILTRQNKSEIKAVAEEIFRPIEKLQETAKSFYEHSRPENVIPQEFRAVVEIDSETTSFLYNNLKYQVWSDGFVYYCDLGDHALQCRVGPAFDMLGFSGALLLFLLADRIPVRGAVEVGWGSELFPGRDEIYGPVVSNAYKLESEIAQFPRIVVGEEAVKFFEDYASSNPETPAEQQSKDLANLALTYLRTDSEGVTEVDYLGEPFRTLIAASTHEFLRKRARKFIDKSLDEFRAAQDGKLIGRYERVQRYFEENGVT